MPKIHLCQPTIYRETKG